MTTMSDEDRYGPASDMIITEDGGEVGGEFIEDDEIGYTPSPWLDMAD
jgi:hypothetical protein